MGNGVECIQSECVACGQPGQPCCMTSGVGDGCSGTCVDGQCMM
jgi:hypothetical protein